MNESTSGWSEKNAAGRPPTRGSDGRTVPRENRYGLVIGVNGDEANRYRRLSHAEDDARSVYELMIKSDLFDPKNVRLLIGPQATRDAILKAFVNINTRLGLSHAIGPAPGAPSQGSESGSESVVWVYFSGHGEAQADRVNWITWDTQGSPTNEGILEFETSTISHQELSDKLNNLLAHAGTAVVMLVDSCFGARAAQPSHMAVPLSEERLRQLLARFHLVALAAAGPDELALELKQLKHGVFTEVAIQGLKGEADVDLDNQVTAADLLTYLRHEVPRLIPRRSQHRHQTPTMTGDDEFASRFVLARPDVTREKAKLVALIEKLRGPGKDDFTDEQADYLYELLKRGAQSLRDRELMASLRRWMKQSDPAAPGIQWMIGGERENGGEGPTALRAGRGTVLLIMPPSTGRGEGAATARIAEAVEDACKAVQLELRKENDVSLFVGGAVRHAEAVVVASKEDPEPELAEALENAVRSPVIVRWTEKANEPTRYDFVPSGAEERAIEATPAGLSGQMLEAVRRALQAPLRRPSRQGSRPACGTLERPLMPPDAAFLAARFRGRVPLLEEAKRLLSDDEVRVIVASGPFGSGRSALLRKILHDVEEESPPERPRFDGVAYLSAIDDRGDRCPDARIVHDLFEAIGTASGDVGKAMGLWRTVERTGASLDPLFELAARGPLAVVIDDFDAVLGDDGSLRPEYGRLQQFYDGVCARKGRGGVRLFIEARRPLARDGVASLEVGPLEVPAAIEVLRDLDSDGTAGLRDAPDGHLADVASTLHGSPRALRSFFRILSAPTTTQRRPTIEEVLASPALLAMDCDGLAAAQLEQLSPEARKIVDILAVFGRAGAPFEGVLAVTEDTFDMESSEARARSRQLLDDLVRRALVVFDRQTYQVTLGRLLRQQAYARLADAGQTHWRTNLHRSVAAYYTQRRATPPSGEEDIRSGILAFEHLMRIGESDAAADLMDGLDYSIDNHHKFTAWMQLRGYGYRVLEMREALRGALTRPDRQVRNLAALGWDARRIDTPTTARARLREAIEIADKHGDRIGGMFARTELGFVQNDCFPEEDAMKTLQTVLDEAERPPREPYWEGMAYLGLAYVHFEHEEDTKALKYAQKADKAFAASSERYVDRRRMDAAVRLCMCYRKAKRYGDAEEQAGKALETAQAVDIPHWEAECRSQNGFNCRAIGEYSKGLEFHEGALRINQGPGLSLREQVAQHSYCANLLIELGRFDQAIGHYETALSLAQSLGLGREQAWVLGGLGIARARAGDLDEAIRVQRMALAIVDKKRPPAATKHEPNARSEVVRRTDLAETLLLQGKYEEAQSQVALALARAATDIHHDGAPVPASAVDAYVAAPYMPDGLPHEMQAPGDHQRRGVILARANLHLGRLDLALRAIQAARRRDGTSNVDTPTRGPEAALLEAVIRRRLGDVAGARTCLEFAQRGPDGRPEAKADQEGALGLQEKDPAGYKGHLVYGAALFGRALLEDASQASDAARALLAEAGQMFRNAQLALSRPGVMKDLVSLLAEMPHGSEHLDAAYGATLSNQRIGAQK